MDRSWTAAIDAYCERTDASFWSEPVNAVTNAAFLIAAALAFHAWRRQSRSDRPALTLILVLTAIGLGSFLFHTFANRWSMLADVIPITIFIYVYFFFAMRRFFGLNPLFALVLTIGFFAVSAAIGAMLPPGFLNGSGGYLPALGAILVVGAILIPRDRESARRLIAAGSVFAVSLGARSIDMAACGSFPLGTHFLWHVLNAVVLYILIIALMRRFGENAAAG
ncbi:ceramidase [Tepidamorphus gemmatus]|uniref:Ceramidase n=1 Tax=Tepidamorphus gemmatus TaxID=747076 RepID=A0A4R3MKR2_9HYPH|nr:ceramidase domain-containing protein [Tepidamorphus gemmatus]TCT12430.1 ceramidase [Tepidamorphus gemmatus]